MSFFGFDLSRIVNGYAVDEGRSRSVKPHVCLIHEGARHQTVRKCTAIISRNDGDESCEPNGGR